jgi:hypothetical protein
MDPSVTTSPSHTIGFKNISTGLWFEWGLAAFTAIFVTGLYLDGWADRSTPFLFNVRPEEVRAFQEAHKPLAGFHESRLPGPRRLSKQQ